MRAFLKSVFVLTVMAFVMLIVTGTLKPPLTHAAGPWYVSNSGNDSYDCLSPATACASINATLNKPGFVAGDTIRVAVGTYTGTGGAVVLLNKSATLSGGWDSGFTSQSGMSMVDGGGIRQGINITGTITGTLDRLRIQNGFSDLGQGGGGGVRVNSGTITMTHLIVTGNNTNDNRGGGIYNSGTLTLVDSTVSSNWSNGWGGGICNTGTMSITNTSISNNDTQSNGTGAGAGIMNYGGTLTLENSTVSNNHVVGTYTIAGIYSSGPLVLNNCTVSGNTGKDGVGVDVYGKAKISNSTITYNEGYGLYSNGAQVTLQNTIIAHNNTVENMDCYIDSAYSNLFTSLGYNIIQRNYSCPTTITDSVNLAPLIGPLQDNGGPTFTHALLLGSRAINGGNPNGCTDSGGNPLSTDQRGMPRFGRCDIGAYEFQGNIFQTFLPIIDRDYCPDFYDDFRNPLSGWSTGDGAYTLAEYLNGEYRILTKQSGYRYLYRAPTCIRQHYIVQVDARWVGSPGNSYGILFGLNSNFTQYDSFEVNTDYQQFRWLRRGPNGTTVLLPPTSSNLIKSGTATNNLRVTYNTGSINLEINGTIVAQQWPVTITDLTNSGIVVSPYSNVPTADARFDNYSVTIIRGTTAPTGGNSKSQNSNVLGSPSFQDKLPANAEWQRR